MRHVSVSICAPPAHSALLAVLQPQECRAELKSTLAPKRAASRSRKVAPCCHWRKTTLVCRRWRAYRANLLCSAAGAALRPIHLSLAFRKPGSKHRLENNGLHCFLRKKTNNDMSQIVFRANPQTYFTPYFEATFFVSGKRRLCVVYESTTL